MFLLGGLEIICSVDAAKRSSASKYRATASRQARSSYRHIDPCTAAWSLAWLVLLM
jgi:hypothetical protein